MIKMNEDIICGVLPINKHAGVTSHDIVNKVRRLYGTKRVGHTGTLDPIATGVLPILIGRAAKAAEYITGGDKIYRAVLKLGITTDTGDITGKVLKEFSAIPSYENVKAAIMSFVGVIKQIPPMYSAIKIDGHKLVDLARKGIEVERESREVSIYSIAAEVKDELSGEYEITVKCSKGTYIRTLCEDIGAKLACGGVMKELCRTYSGGFGIESSHTLNELDAMTGDELTKLLLPVENVFCDLPEVKLPDFFAHLAHSGAEIYLHKIKAVLSLGDRVRLSDSNGFFAIGEVTSFPDGDAIKPLKQFVL